MSHEGILYCKPHHRELFQPKVVVREHDDVHNTKTQEAIGALPQLTSFLIKKFES
jgi:hypothetical protein